MTGNDAGQETSPDVRDKRIPPSGVLPKNTQAWVLSGLAAVMVAVIALSGRNAPKEKSKPFDPAPPAATPNVTQIHEYEVLLRDEAQRLQVAKEQLGRTQQALGVAPGIDYSRSTGMRLSPIEPGAAENTIQVEKDKREEQSLFASNVALSYRKESVSVQTPTASSPADLVAKALSTYVPATPIAAPAGTASVAAGSA